jgi:hypothetical protein
VEKEEFECGTYLAHFLKLYFLHIWTSKFNVVAFLFWKSIEQKIWPIKKEFPRLKKTSRMGLLPLWEKVPDRADEGFKKLR